MQGGGRGCQGGRRELLTKTETQREVALPAICDEQWCLVLGSKKKWDLVMGTLIFAGALLVAAQTRATLKLLPATAAVVAAPWALSVSVSPSPSKNPAPTAYPYTDADISQVPASA